MHQNLTDLLEFLRVAASDEALSKMNGTTLKALTDSYFDALRATETAKEVQELRKELAVVRAALAEAQDTRKSEAPPLRPETLDTTQPNQVYLIRHKDSGRVYVGRALMGFLHRYPEGKWWVSHSSESLARELHWKGHGAFDVRVFQCHSADDAAEFERRLFDHFYPCVYNAVRP